MSLKNPAEEMKYTQEPDVWIIDVHVHAWQMCVTRLN